MDRQKIHTIFNRFAGKEIPMTETKLKHHVGGKDFLINDVRPTDPKDPTLEDFKKTAAAEGLSLRVFWEGVDGTCDYRTDRINAEIKKKDDGTWRISDRFIIG